MNLIQFPSVSNITNIMPLCHSEAGESPLDIAKKHGHTKVVSMMTEEMACELKY